MAEPIHSKGAVRNISYVESAKDKIFEAYSNLVKMMTIHQGTKKMLAQYPKLYDEKKANTVQTTLNNFFTKK